MRKLSDTINQLWRECNNMPRVTRQAPPTATVLPFTPNGDILDAGVPATEIGGRKITAAVYGRNGVGKTTFACQGEGPIALLSVEPSPTGGARSVMGRKDITIYQVAAGHLSDRDGKQEPLRGSEKMLAIAEALRHRFAAGQRPFRKVVIDGISSWNDVILSEVMGLDYNQMPAVLGLGKVTSDQYIERSERLIRYLRPFFDLPCDLWVVAQERDHNPPKDTTTTRSGKEYTRPSQSSFMREAHPLAQEGSFFSLAVSDTQAKWVQDACDFIMQIYEDDEVREEKLPDVNFNGELIPGQVQVVATGRRVKRLRCVYHPNYAARFRAPDYRAVPEYIEAPTPEDRYTAFLDVVAGRKTKYGHYPESR